MKTNIIQTIQEELSRFGLECFKNDEADIIIHEEFQNNKWNDKIKWLEYKLYIGVHELDETIYVQERLSEKDKGFTFRLKLNNDSLYGNQLYRTVKISRYKGKSVSIEYNLKEILITIKRIALNYNYQCKEVMMLGKIKEAHDNS